MEKRLLMALIAGLILSTGWLHAQDSGDSGDSSDTSGTGTTDATSPGDASVTDVSDVSNDALGLTPTDPTLDFAAQQAYDAITTPWGGVPAPLTFGNDAQFGPGGNPVPGEPGQPGTFSPGSPAPPAELVPRAPWSAYYCR